MIGTQHEYRGETVCAYVVLASGRNVDAAGLDAYCRKHLAAYKVPRNYHFMDTLPKTSVGKIDKLELRKITAR